MDADQWQKDIESSFNPYQPLGDSIDNFFAVPEMTVPPPLPMAPVPVMPVVKQEPHQIALPQLMQMVETQNDQLEEMKQRQVAIARGQDSMQGQQLLQEYNQVSMQLSTQIEQCLAMHVNSVIPADHLHLHRRALSELNYQLASVQLLREEMTQVMGASVARPLARLFISEQPFPSAVTKSKPIKEGSLSVRLITGCVLPGRVLGECEAVLMVDAGGGKKKTTKKGPLSSHTSSFHNGIATFSDIKFEQGSRRQPVKCKFRVQVELAGGETGHIESDPTEPFIVITNESQWEASEGNLMTDLLFPGNTVQVSWPAFVNTLQAHFIRCTRQDPERPDRPLSGADFALFRGKLGANDFVSKRTLKAFWASYGKCLQVLRYQRHISSLFCAGLVYGWMSRDDVSRALQGQPPGAFLLRFSDGHPGCFAVAYVGQNAPRPKIMHYLVQPTDTLSAKKSLPDFLSECHQFQYVLQLTTAPDGTLQLQRYPKDTMFEEFYAKRASIDPGPGYDPLNPPGQLFGEL